MTIKFLHPTRRKARAERAGSASATPDRAPPHPLPSAQTLAYLTTA
jgi:hypothetical protein